MQSSTVSCRRDFLQTAGLSLLGLPLAQGLFVGTGTAATQSAAQAGEVPALPPLNRFPRMMQDWLVDQVRAVEVRGNALREALKSRADAAAYVKSVQERIRQS